jgi:hypothetical protein
LQLAELTHHITHKDGFEADIAITTPQLSRAQGGSGGDQKSIAIAFGHEMWANDELASRRDQRPFIDFDDLIIEDLSPIGHRD